MSILHFDGSYESRCLLRLNGHEGLIWNGGLFLITGHETEWSISNV